MVTTSTRLQGTLRLRSVLEFLSCLQLLFEENVCAGLGPMTSSKFLAAPCLVFQYCPISKLAPFILAQSVVYIHSNLLFLQMVSYGGDY